MVIDRDWSSIEDSIFREAKKGAMERVQTTVLWVEQVDSTNATIVEMGLEIAETFCPFSQTLVTGIDRDIASI